MNPPHQAPSVQQLACRESQSAKSHGKETHKHIHVPRNRRHTCKFYPHLSKQITGIALRGDTETGAFNTSTVKIGCVCTEKIQRLLFRLFYPNGSLVFSSFVSSLRHKQTHTPHPFPPCECKQYWDIIKSHVKPIIHLHRLTVYRPGEHPFTTSNQ